MAANRTLALGRTVSVGPARPEDRDTLTAMAESAGFRLDLDAELARRHALIWVARQTSPGAGALGLLLAWAVADELELLLLVTRADARRRGIGKRLLHELLQRAEALGASAIHLEVRSSNEPAIALYRSFGFGLARVRRAYYATHSEDALEMSLFLDDNTVSQEPGRSPGAPRDPTS